jgi:hypothetical protein
MIKLDFFCLHFGMEGVFCSQYVCFRVEGRRGGMGVAETIVGVRRKYWESVEIYFTISSCRLSVLIHGCGSPTMIVVTLCVMHISYWLLSNLSLWMQLKIIFGTYRFSLEDFCMETLARQVTNKNKYGDSRHHHSKISFMCVWLWWHWINSALIPIL